MPTTPGGLLAATADAADLAAVLVAAADALRSWVGVGPVFLSSADPVTGLFGPTFSRDIATEAAARFLAIEMTGRDVVPFAGLARGRQPVGSLFAATEGRPEHSARWREVIEPLGWGDELRAAVRAGGTTWGYVCLHRDGADRPFTGKDVARLSRLLPALAAALRRSARPTSSLGESPGTGVVLTGPADRLLGTSGSAAEWLEQCGPALPGGLPLPVAALVRRVLRNGRPAESVLLTRAARWAGVSAAPLDGSGAGQVAVVIGPATADQLLGRLAAAAGLTRREQDVMRAAVRGLSTRAIARTLVISEQTVQTHLRSVFRKTGVHSRGELLGILGG